MTGSAVCDRIARGMGVAARRIGASYDAYRPEGEDRPLVHARRFLRLHAAFNAMDPKFRRAQGYGRATWYGVFDSSYTRPGDYLRGERETWFVASQDPLLPVLCVRTNKVLDLARPAGPGLPGLDGYGGVQAGLASEIGRGWAASVLAHGSGAPGVLPGDSRLPSWEVLLPPSCIELQADDLLRDQEGIAYVVSSAERSALGWRILAREAVS